MIHIMNFLTLQYSFYTFLSLLSKPILPIEVKYQLKNDNEASGCDDEDDDGSGEEDNDGHDDPFNWNPEKVLQHAQSMFNIKRQQEKTSVSNRRKTSFIMTKNILI